MGQLRSSDEILVLWCLWHSRGHDEAWEDSGTDADSPMNILPTANADEVKRNLTRHTQ